MSVSSNSFYVKALTDVIGIGVTINTAGGISTVDGPTWRRVTADPNGTVTANAGSLASQTNGTLWINTDSATAWTSIGGSGGASDFDLKNDIIGSWGTTSPGKGESVFVSGSNRFDLRTEAATGTTASSALRLVSGTSTASTAVVGGGSGNVTVRSGDTDATDAGGTGGVTGAWSGGSGNAASTLGVSGATGLAKVSSGDSTDGASGQVSVLSGTGATSTGLVEIGSGNASAGNSGNVQISTGTATGTRGTVVVNAPSINFATQAIDFSLIDNNASALRFLAGVGGGSVITIGTLNSGQTVAVDGRLTTTDGVTGGTVRVVGGLAYSTVADSAQVTNTNVETAFSTGAYAIPGNTLKANTQIRVVLWGIAPTTNAADTLTIALRFGAAGVAAQIVCQTAAVDVANGDLFRIETVISIRTAGAGGTMVGSSQWTLGAAGTAGTFTFRMASAAIDTTVARSLTATAAWNAISPNDQAVLEGMCVWID